MKTHINRLLASLLFLAPLLSANAAITPEGFSRIPSGTCVLGDAVNGNGVSVYLSEFYISQTHVTLELWNEVKAWGLNNNYTDLPDGTTNASDGDPNLDDQPIRSVNWFDATKWCNAYSEMQGLTPVYYNSDGSVIRTGQNTPEGEAPANTNSPEPDWSADGYRLPTEAEWEKAARGGLSNKRFPWGDEINHDHAIYKASNLDYVKKGKKTESFPYDTSGYTVPTSHPEFGNSAPVGSFPANGYGVYDMAGLAWEWTWAPHRVGEGEEDPTGGIPNGDNRVRRGGGFSSRANDCRIHYRRATTAGARIAHIGFRIARNSPDRDSDQLIDSWETLYFGSAESVDGTGDYDGDGTIDFFEQLAGSNPLDPSSKGFAWATRPHEDGVSQVSSWTVREDLAIGEDYEVEVSTDLSTWSSLAAENYTFQANPADSMQTLEITLGQIYGPNVFFRFKQ